MQFEFQYDRRELRSLRSASRIRRDRPSLNLFAWIAGGWLGTWLLFVAGYPDAIWLTASVTAIMVLAYARHLFKRPLQPRRIIQLNDSGIIETVAQSQFHKSWSALHEFTETGQLFVLRHFESVCGIPKRVIPEDQMASIRDLMKQRVGQPGTESLIAFRHWIQSESGSAVYTYQWNEADIRDLQQSALRPFDKDAETPGRSMSWTWFWMVALLIVLLALLATILDSGNPADRTKLFSWKLLFVPLGGLMPLIFGIAWWKFSRFRMRGTRLRFPDQPIHLRLSDTGMVIGYPTAIGRIAWSDIRAFYYDPKFIGFQTTHDDLVHVISSRAFAGPQQAVQFLRQASSYLETARQAFVKNVDPVETGNPYQAPTTGNERESS